MKLLKHPNILPLYAAFLDDDQLWMVMPYVSGGSAIDIMRRTSPNVSLAGHAATRITAWTAHCAPTPSAEHPLCITARSAQCATTSSAASFPYRG
jgi:serine/threonine protein kinase